ncbi:hypothetical protein [Thaumasiovibrio sp. DFM-14]|uniref:hypothetical protein n=1 Tax=Thaumasiovibrio sp. DFM-14 TaxID=3384792 RepID=UPI0039A1590E
MKFVIQSTIVGTCLLFSVMLFSVRVYANAVDITLSHYSKATYLASQGQYLQAAEQWHRLTVAFLSAEATLGRKKMWQHAGLSEALAAMSADRANDAVAYQYWADSTRYLMTGGADWSQMQKQLHRRYEQMNTMLATQLQVTDLAASIDSEWQQDLTTLQIWRDKLEVFQFRQPRLGLKDKTISQRDTNQFPPAQPIPALRHPPRGKKLSGLRTNHGGEQHITPSEVAENELELELDSPNIAPLSDTSISGVAVEAEKTLKGEKTALPEGNSPLPEDDANNNVITPSQSGNVARQLVVKEAQVKVEASPTMSKGIIVRPSQSTQPIATSPVSAPSSSLSHIAPDATQVNQTDAGVRIAPIEQYDFTEESM